MAGDDTGGGAARRARRRIGHRGAFLLAVAAYDLFYGLYLAIGGSIQHVPVIGERPWGWIWLGVSVFLACGSLFRRDAVFYAAAVLVKMVWALEFFVFDVEYHDTDDWVRGCYWLALAAMVAVCAFWPEPVQIIKPPPPDPTGADAVQRARDA